MVKITLIKATDLFDTDAGKIWGKLDPYVVVKLDCRESGGTKLKVTGDVYRNVGCNPIFGKKGQGEVLEIECKADEISEADLLRIEVKDEDMCSEDDHVGEATFNLLSLCAACVSGGNSGNLVTGEEHCVQLYRNGTDGAGKIVVTFSFEDALTAKALSIPDKDRYPVASVYTKLHRNLLAGMIVNHDRQSTMPRSRQDFITYEVAIPREIILQHFEDQWQFNYDESHAKIFADNAEGIAIRATICAEHASLYRDGVRPNWLRPEGLRTEVKRIQRAREFLDIILNGIRDGKHRVFTFVLLDEGMFFSETGEAMSKDVMSKHAVHANGNAKVRYAGTFRVAFDGAEPVFVMDNDSGTYRPDGNDGWRLKKTLEGSFVGFKVRMLSVMEEQPEDTKSWRGPVETGEEQVYPGKWVWQKGDPTALGPTVVLSASDGKQTLPLAHGRPVQDQQGPCCSTPGCSRETWNGQPGQSCCRTCTKTNGGGAHGPDCEAKFSQKAEPPLVCPTGHSMHYFTTPKANFNCDVCQKRFPMGTRMVGCRTCNIDWCIECKSGSAKGETSGYPSK